MAQVKTDAPKAKETVKENTTIEAKEVVGAIVPDAPAAELAQTPVVETPEGEGENTQGENTQGENTQGENTQGENTQGDENLEESEKTFELDNEEDSKSEAAPAPAVNIKAILSNRRVVSKAVAQSVAEVLSGRGRGPSSVANELRNRRVSQGVGEHNVEQVRADNRIGE